MDSGKIPKGGVTSFVAQKCWGGNTPFEFIQTLPPQLQGRMAQTFRSRSWCFTANLPSDVETPILDQPMEEVIYQVWQYEEVNHRHIQGYAYFKNPITAARFKKLVFTWCNVKAHVEVARGSPEKNKKYCTKEESRVAGPFEFGSMRDIAFVIADILEELVNSL